MKKVVDNKRTKISLKDFTFNELVVGMFMTGYFTTLVGVFALNIWNDIGALELNWFFGALAVVAATASAYFEWKTLVEFKELKMVNQVFKDAFNWKPLGLISVAFAIGWPYGQALGLYYIVVLHGFITVLRKTIEPYVNEEYQKNPPGDSGDAGVGGDGKDDSDRGNGPNIDNNSGPGGLQAVVTEEFAVPGGAPTSRVGDRDSVLHSPA